MRAWPWVKLLCPLAGCGALALVVATAWLLLPEAAAVPFAPVVPMVVDPVPVVPMVVDPVPVVPMVVDPVPAAPGAAAPVCGPAVPVLPGMVVLLWLGGVVCAAATPRLSAASAAPITSAFMGRSSFDSA